MSHHIHSWIDGHLAVRERAYETRGAIELDPRRALAAHDRRRCRRDRRGVRPACARTARPASLRRWRALLDDLERERAARARRDVRREPRVLDDPRMVAIFLDDVAVPPPAPTLWDALIDEIGGAGATPGRREDGPFAHFDGIKTYDDLWNAQRKFLADKRGADMLAPPAGFGGVTHRSHARPTPMCSSSRPTGASGSEPRSTSWARRHVATWHAAIVDVDQLAKPGKPDDVYAKNNEFWRRAARSRSTSPSPTKRRARGTWSSSQ